MRQGGQPKGGSSGHPEFVPAWCAWCATSETPHLFPQTPSFEYIGTVVWPPTSEHFMKHD